MGRKKFHLVVRKNGERKRYTKFSPPSMIVSIPKAQLPACDLPSLAFQLRDELPKAWSLTTSSRKDDEKIILYSLETSSLNPILRYSITIRECFTWYVSAFGCNISPQSCRVLCDTHDKLNTLSKVKKLMSVIDCCKVCEGNSDAKFMEVAKRRDGIFNDPSGKIRYSINY